MTLSSSPRAFLSVYTLTASPRVVVPNGARASDAAERWVRPPPPPPQAVLQARITDQADNVDRMATEVHTPPARALDRTSRHRTCRLPIPFCCRRLPPAAEGRMMRKP